MYDYQNCSIAEKMALCREAHLVFGLLSAQQLWSKLGLEGYYSPLA